MSPLLNCKSLSKAYSLRLLFEDLSFSIFPGDHIGLIGPNGSGKSTLLKIVAGQESADQGEVVYKKGIKVGYVPQSSHFPALSPMEILLQVQPKQHIVEKWLTKVGFSLQEPSAALLSGGWKRRLAIAQAMVQMPDILLFDEPTNHLDLEGVLWLERFIKQELSTFLVVSHDRTFLQQLANQIVEINPIYPKGLFSVQGSYDQFLEKKELFIEGQIERERSIASKVRRESEWLKQNPKARTTKSQSRIDSADELFEEYAAIKHRNRVKKSFIALQASERESKKLLVAKNIGVHFGGKELFAHLDLTLTAGTKLGLLGTNGSGKTTLLKILAGEIEPTQGTVKRADRLKIVHFDQHRAQLADTLSLREALAPNGDYVTFQGRQIHVHGWAERFLFPAHLLNLPIGALSGGERARISIAKLMLEPADILLLDEPTNDLDITTLEVLEENLIEFSGATVLITHDRTLLQRSCNLFLRLAIDGPAHIYESYVQCEGAQESKKESVEKVVLPKPIVSKPKSRSFKDLEKKITEKEEQHRLLGQELQNPKILENRKQLEEVCKKMELLEKEIEGLYEQL